MFQSDFYSENRAQRAGKLAATKFPTFWSRRMLWYLDCARRRLFPCVTICEILIPGATIFLVVVRHYAVLCPERSEFEVSKVGITVTRM